MIEELFDPRFDRNNPAASIVGMAAYIGGALASYRYGASIRHPVAGAIVGAVVAGPLAAGMARWVVGMVIPPSNVLPANTIANNPPANQPANPRR